MRGELRAQRQRRVDIVGTVNPGEQTAGAAFAADLIQQRRFVGGAGARHRVIIEEGHAPLFQLRCRGGERVETVDTDRLQLLAEYCLDRSLPAGGDLQPLCQPRLLRQTVLLQPVVDYRSEERRVGKEWRSRAATEQVRI